MYFHHVLFSICVFMVAAGAATNVTLTSILPLVPQCALKCLLTEVSPSALTNPTIICTNTTLELSLSACIQGACNYTEQTTIASLEAQLCEGSPEESRSWPIAIFGIVLGPLALLAVALRFYYRISIAKKLGIDDWLILVAATAVATISVLDVYNCLENGFGRHVWDIDPHRARELLKIFYAGEISYLMAMTLIKASILVFYLRISQSSWFWAADIVVLIMTVTAGIATSLAVVLQCTPISGAWTIPFGSAKCVNTNALAFASGGITVFLDIVVLLLPVPELVRLRMELRKKFTILIMFSLGSLACVTSIVRLKYLIDFAKSKDATFDNYYAVIWTLLEMNIAMICSCLPAFRGLLCNFFPSIFEHTVRESEKPPTPSNITAPLTQATRLEKSGPSYNKWALRSEPTSPEPSDLASLDESAAISDKVTRVDKDADIETKIWIHPRFKTAGELVAFMDEDLEIDRTEKGLSLVPSRSTGTSLWCLEGPRLSEDVRRALGLGIEGLGSGSVASGSANEMGWDGDEDGEREWQKELERDVEAGYLDADMENVESGVATRRFLSSPKVKKVRRRWDGSTGETKYASEFDGIAYGAEGVEGMDVNFGVEKES